MAATYILFIKQVKSMVGSLICECELLGLNLGQGINWLL
jgi:hypothetical protein